MSDKASPSKALTPAMARLLLVAVVILWGANWPVMKVGVQSMPPLWFASARMILGALSLFALLVVLGRLKLPTRRDLPVVLTVGGLQMGAFLALVNTGLQHVEAGRSSILAYTTPLWVAPAAILLLGEAVNLRKLLGLTLGLTGVAVLFNPLGFDWTSGVQILGNALLLAAAMLGSVAILHVRAHQWDSSPLQLAPWQMVLAALPLGLLSGLTEDWSAVRWSGDLGLILLYNGPLATAFCFWAVVSVTRALPAVTSSLSLLAVPVAGVLASTVFLAEPLTPTLVGGLVLILSGTVLVNLADLSLERSERRRAGERSPGPESP